MLVCPFLISFSLATSRPDPLAVAFSARIYYPPQVHKLSHSKLYTCALDGSKRRCWTKDRGEVRDVWWKSKDVLRYTVDFPKDSGDGMTEEWQLNVAKQTRVLLAKGKTEGRLGNRDSSLLTGSMSRYDARTALKKLGHEVAFDEVVGNVTIKGHPPLEFPDRLWSQVVDAKHDRFWIFTYDHDSTTGANYSAYLVNWTSNLAEPKFTHARTFDFRVDRTIYAMVSQRDTMPYDKKRTVWMSQAIVGDWKSGERHLIAGPANLNESDLQQPFAVSAKRPDQSYQFAIALRP